jgi:hypothetical protein
MKQQLLLSYILENIGRCFEYFIFWQMYTDKRMHIKD